MAFTIEQIERSEQNKTEIIDRLEQSKNELIECIDKCTNQIIKWMIGLFLGISVLNITALWVILRYAI